MQLDSEILAVDTETTSLNTRDGDMFSVQIGTGVNNYLVDMQDWNNGIKFEEVIPYLEDKYLVFHNAQFDLQFFYKHGFYPNLVQDTFLASKILYNGIPQYRHGFAYVFEREMDINYDKSVQQDIARVQLRTVEAIQYCFQDVDRLIELMNLLWKKCASDGCLESYLLHASYARVLAYMQVCGLPINKSKWQAKMKIDLEQLAKTKATVSDYIYQRFPHYRDPQIDLFDPSKEQLGINLDSPAQMIPVFKDLGINTINSKGKNSIKEDVITKTPHEFVPLWLEYKSASHTVSTFGQTVLDKIEDGRIYTDFNPLLDTSRISTRKNYINFLNFPANPRTRQCFEHEEGYKIIVADYTAHEGVVNADITGDAMMRKSVLEDADLHSAFARVLFPELENVDDETLKNDHDDERTAAKAPRFLFQYGGNAFTLHVNENIPLDEATKIEEDFKELHKGIYTWGDKVLERALKCGYIESCLGFKLHLPYFDDFLSLHARLDECDNEFWQDYRKGKQQYKDIWAYRNFVDDPPPVDAEEPNGPRMQWEGPVPEVYDQTSYYTYTSNKSWISDYFSQKAKYLKLCLNNPIQSTASHQFKNGGIKLLNKIIENGHMGRVRLVNAIHDEFVLEVEEELVDQYVTILEECMIQGGMELMQNEDMILKADADVGLSWGSAKKK